MFAEWRMMSLMTGFESEAVRDLLGDEVLRDRARGLKSR